MDGHVAGEEVVTAIRFRGRDMCGQACRGEVANKWAVYFNVTNISEKISTGVPLTIRIVAGDADSVGEQA